MVNWNQDYFISQYMRELKELVKKENNFSTLSARVLKIMRENDKNHYRSIE